MTTDTAPVRHLPADAAIADITAVLRSDGAVVIDEVVGRDVVDRALEELRPFIEATPYSGDDFGGRRTKRTGALIARSATARGLVMDPLIRDVVRDILGHATNHQLHLTQIISIEPGQAAQPVHRDQWAFDFFPFPGDYEVQCNTIWAGTDFTEENGATRVVVGSNHAEDRLRFEHDETVAAEMSKGSVLVYLGSVYHGGGANSSERTRVGINITYNVGWLRQEENQFLSVPSDVAVTLDDDLLKLMGYSMGAYALGYVGDVQHPLDSLRGRTGAGDLGGGEITPEARA
jgi:ectoine hydroxylase-related dioxygenase (phytanoyl-CoA dioxygenase family)